MQSGSDDKHGGAGPRPSEQDTDAEGNGKRANAAPDAVMDPNEKTDGKPGVPPGSQGGETDPGGS